MHAPGCRFGCNVETKSVLRLDITYTRASKTFWRNNGCKSLSAVSQLPTLDTQLHRGLKGWASESKDYSVRTLHKDVFLDKALDSLSLMDQQGIVPSVEVYRSILTACIKRKALVQTKKVYAHLAKHGLELTGYLGEAVVNTLVKCFGLQDALEVFQRLQHRTVVSWTAIISGYAQTGQAREALRMYWHMQEEGVQPDAFTFVSVLKACGSMADLEQGKCMHAEAVKYRCESSLIVGTCLIDMYAKCGSIQDAHDVFQWLLHRDVISWNVMLAAYVQQGNGAKVFLLYQQLQEEGLNADDRTLVTVLQACGIFADREDVALLEGQLVKPQSLTKGKAMHVEVQKKGYESDMFVGNALVTLYGKCGSAVDAQHAFDSLVQRDVVSWNTLLAGYAQSGRMEKCLQLYHEMLEEEVSANARTYVMTLRACCSPVEGITNLLVSGEAITSKRLQNCKVIHAEAWRRGYESDFFLGSTLISTYGKYGSIVDAQTVFEGLTHRNVVSWTSMLSAYAQQGYGEKALHVYAQLQEGGVSPNSQTIVSALQACSILAEQEGVFLRQEGLERGRLVHAEAWRRGYDTDVFVGNALMSLYATCGSIVDAECVFGRLLQRDKVSWNSMITGYCQHGEWGKAFQLYNEMEEEVVSPDVRTLVSVLQACANLAETEGDVLVNGQWLKVDTLRNGRVLHADAKRRGFESDVFLGNGLINVYGKCGSIIDAQYVFERLPWRDVVTWNAILAMYEQQGNGEKCVQFYCEMQEEPVSPDARTFVSALQACGKLAENEASVLLDGQSLKVVFLHKGKVLHAEVWRRGFESDAFVASTLIFMYGKCGSINDAQLVFDTFSKRTLVSWTAILMVYVQQRQGGLALQLYYQMHEEVDSSDVHILVSAMHACTALTELEDLVLLGEQSLRLASFQKAKALHAEAHRRGFTSDLLIGNVLITLYASCGSILDAQSVFSGLSEQDTESWTGILAAYVQQHEPEKALQLYDQMQESGVSPDAWTIVNALQACGSLAGKEKLVVEQGQSLRVESLQKGKAIHAEPGIKGYESYVFISNALITMYGKCGCLVDAQTVFDEMSQPDVVSWHAILAAYAQQGEADTALQLYEEMLLEGFSPDDNTIVLILQACGDRGTLYICKEIHRTLLSTQREFSCVIANTLIDTYGKCGAILDAQNVFDGLLLPDVVSWTTLITAYSRQGDSETSLQVYKQMQLAGVKPNGVTFLALFSACSCAGIVDRAVEHFESMSREYGITPQIEHYGSMVDMFGRLGFFTVVEDFLSEMPIQPDLSMWLSLLAACRKHGNVVLGKRAFQCAVDLQPNAVAAYALMLDIYASAGMWESAKKVDELRQKP